MSKGKKNNKGETNCEASTMAVNVETELITMDTVRKQVNQMLAQQKAHYTEMLDRQADTFNKFVCMLMDSTNERLDSMNRNIQELKDSIHYTQQEVDEMKVKTSKVLNDHNTLEGGMRTICDTLLVLEKNVDHLENQSRRNNLIFRRNQRIGWGDSS